jgi:beta-lactam-binding protein with PASTA domain
VLTRANLRVEVVRVVDGSRPAGTVVRTEPPAGTLVAPDSLVRVVVAQQPPATSPAPSASS